MASLFVYGSLMARVELERVLGRPYEGPYRPHVLYGYQRKWTAVDGEIAYLDLYEDSDAKTTGFLVEISNEDLERLDTWETGYQRVDAGSFQVYVSKSEYRRTGKVVLQSYLELVQPILGEVLPPIPDHLRVVDFFEES